MSNLIDERAPWSVRAAAILMSIAALVNSGLAFMVNNSGDIAPISGAARLRPILVLAMGLLIAWLVARLNGLAYGFALIRTAFGIAVWALMWLLAGFRPEDRLPLTQAGIVIWTESVLGIMILVLLVLPSSIKAPWSLSNGFSRS